MNIFVYEITGTAHGLLMNSPSGMKRTGSSVGLNSKKIPTEQEEAAANAYKTKDGHMWFPSQGFKSALVSASKGRRIGKQSATGVLKGCVFCIEEQVLLIKPTGEQIKATDYSIDMRPVVIQKARILRCRPVVSPWACLLPLEVDDMVSEKLVEEILNMAGRTIGVGDYRPEKGGPFGRFTAKLRV